MAYRYPRYYDDYEEPILVVDPPRPKRGQRLRLRDYITEMEQDLEAARAFEKKMKGDQFPKPPQMHPLSAFILTVAFSTGFSIIINLLLFNVRH